MVETTSAAPVGPELDADVHRCNFGPDAHPCWRLPYSTDGAAAMKFLSYLTLSASVTINYVIRDDDEDWYRVELVGINPDDGDWDAEGEGGTVIEAICRAATHMQDA